ncbi:uncharacterized protein [Diabrotica undecimpunctata]|uniref:uncharacterized protein n=1 Tax=Diabrotica undecimpunctata TaxID=50387 RepID=UPI003B6354BE
MNRIQLIMSLIKDQSSDQWHHVADQNNLVTTAESESSTTNLLPNQIESSISESKTSSLYLKENHGANIQKEHLLPVTIPIELNSSKNILLDTTLNDLQDKNTLSSSKLSSDSLSDSESSSCLDSRYRSSEVSRNDPFSEDNSVKDPNFDSSIDSSSSEHEEDKLQLPKSKKRKVENRQSENIKPTRKRITNPDTWKKVENKKLRNSGQEYTYTPVIKSKDGKTVKSKVTKEKRSILPLCGLKCKLRQVMQREFILSNTKTVTPRYTNVQNPRKPNKAYFFLNNNKAIRVCKLFFIATLAINHKVISTVFRKLNLCDSCRVLENDKRGRHGNHYKISENVKNNVRNHINSIPRIESHYCRANISKEFIDGSKTITDLHRDYTKQYQCEDCVQYRNCNDEHKQDMEEKYNKHIKEKDLSRKEKEKDKDSDDNDDSGI